MTNGTTYYKNPATMLTGTLSSSAINKVRKAYYKYENDEDTFYFTGQFWFKKSDTSLATTESNKNYVVAVNTLASYQYPMTNDSYAVEGYNQGDRITILYTADNDSNWGYTGRGWVQIANNLTEIL
jgi:hypothetical protein